MRKNYKPLIIGILCALIVVMAVGFALLREQLTITGTSHIDSNWNIRITNIRVKSLNSAYSTGDNASKDNDETVVGDCTTKTVKNGPCDSTTANFDAKLVTPGDSITYEVTITNSGNLDGVVESINLGCSENEAITCTTSGLNVADTISHTSPNNTNTVDVTVTYNSGTESQPVNTNSTITLTINYQQDLGQVTPVYDYSIGDTITYKGAAWRVIKNSTSSEDYVTLMKETVLTYEELGNNYAYSKTCSKFNVREECYSVGTTNYDSVAYYWSSTCHDSGTYGIDTYDSKDDSGCSGHNDYAGSRIKQAVEGYMTTNNMTNDLKEIDNYKIRLITKDELMDNLGYEAFTQGTTSGIGKGSTTPAWVYNTSYWTMTISPDDASGVWGVNSGGGPIGNVDVCNFHYRVRPVINLLKPAIPAQS